MTGRASIRITKHAARRAFERTPFKRRALQSAVDKAFDRGVQPQAVKEATTRRWLESKVRGPGDEVRAHGGFVFLFGFDAGDYHLITVVPVPAEFRETLSR